MLYRYLLSKKGFTMIEILVVVIVMSILVAVAVPVFSASLNKQRIKDCESQKIMIETTVKQAMNGMMDNGKKQKKIDFNKVSQSDHRTTYTADKVTGNGDDSLNGKACFVVGEDQALPGVISFTLGDLRGGYRNNKFDDYDTGFEDGHYLKKERLKNIKFYNYFTNSEIPVCPFADFSNNDKTDDYRYFIFEDGSVMCSCPKCHE